MEINYSSINQNQIALKTGSEQNSQLSFAFINTLNNVISKDLTNVIMPNEHMSNANFLKKKGEVEDIKVNLDDGDQHEESVYKTVKEIEKRLVALARLERKMMAGF
ncbi:MAG: hypothetical protein WC860_03640 [Candidatus Margulisiibacteriota bacterium]|jgi:hypothetical protein